MTGYSTDKKPTSPSPIEAVSEYKNSTRRAGEAAPPRAAQFNKGATNIGQIREATEARRQQSNSWATRDVGPQELANRDSKMKRDNDN
jgi:hypothetical protein